MAKPTFAISLTFVTKAKDYDAAHELAERIGSYVVADKMASEFSTIDVELIDEDEDSIEELNFDGDDE